jgi:hypothetical protein
VPERADARGVAGVATDTGDVGSDAAEVAAFRETETVLDADAVGVAPGADAAPEADELDEVPFASDGCAPESDVPVDALRDADPDGDGVLVFPPDVIEGASTTGGIPKPAGEGGVAPVSNGLSGRNNWSSPNSSSESSIKGASEDTAADGLAAGAAGAASFKASSSKSVSLSPRRLSGSIISAAGSSGLAFRDSAVAEAPGDAEVASAGTLPSMGASTGRSVSGSKTGRDAASIVSSLVNASSNAIGLRGNDCGPYVNKPTGRRGSSLAGVRSPLQLTWRVSKQCRALLASRWLTQRTLGLPERDAGHTCPETF